MISIVDDEGVNVFQEHAMAHMEEMGISGWRLEILETDPKGARICID